MVFRESTINTRMVHTEIG